MQIIHRKNPEKRTCRVCKHRYRPRWEEQVTCGGTCAKALSAKGRYPVAFAVEIAKRKAAKKCEIETLCARRWPELSVREIEIFNFAVQVGYDRGYNKGYTEMKRRYTRKDAA